MWAKDVFVLSEPVSKGENEGMQVYVIDTDEWRNVKSKAKAVNLCRFSVSLLIEISHEMLCEPLHP